MSRSHFNSISCPRCGKKTNFQIWDSLNASLDPIRKMRLLTGELNTFLCQQCGLQVLVDYDMIYHDMEIPLLVYATTDENKLHETSPFQAFQSFMDEQQYILRTVHGLTDLCEKVAIFDAQLDDRIIELLKQSYVHSRQKAGKNKPLNAVLFFVRNGKQYFSFVREGEEDEFVEISMELYEETRAKFMGPIDSMPHSYVIDSLWAKNFLEDMAATFS